MRSAGKFHCPILWIRLLTAEKSESLPVGWASSSPPTRQGFMGSQKVPNVVSCTKMNNFICASRICLQIFLNLFLSLIYHWWIVSLIKGSQRRTQSNCIDPNWQTFTPKSRIQYPCIIWPSVHHGELWKKIRLQDVISVLLLLLWVIIKLFMGKTD